MNARVYKFVSLALCVAATACASHASDSATSEDTAEGALTSGALAAGHYSLAVRGEPGTSHWINDLVVLKDGVFTASFGTDLSSVSGHQFSASGTYKAKRANGITTVTFTYAVSDGAGRHTDSDVFEFRQSANNQIQANFAGSPTETFPLALEANDRMAKLEFDANSDPKLTGTLKAGDLLELRYAADRAPCGDDDNAWVSAYAKIDGHAQIFGFDESLAGQDRVVAVVVPQQPKLVLWFQSGAESCQKWDSNWGNNYEFDIH